MSDPDLFDDLDGEPHDRDHDIESTAPETLADHLFLDAMLRELLEDDAESAASQVDRALADVDTPTQRRPRRLRRRTWIAAAAALLLIAIAWFAWPSAREQQLEVLADRVAAEFAREVDRTYQLTVHQALTGRVHQHEFFSRGPRHYVLRFHLDDGRTFTMGRDGDEVWLVPARDEKPVLISAKVRAFRKLIEGHGLDLLAMDAHGAVAYLGKNYRLRDLPDTTGNDWRHVEAHRRWGVKNGPPRLELQIENETGRVQRLTAHWDTRMRIFRGRRVTLTLTKEQRLPDGFFGHAAHHAPGRKVRRL